MALDFINILGTFYDNSVEHTAVIAEQVKDLRLNKYQQDINEALYTLLAQIENRLQNIETNGTKEKYNHQLITKQDYDNLTSYEKDTIYLIIDTDEASVFGGTFPFILGGVSSKFGGTFPFHF